MGDINRTTYFYRHKFSRKEREYNREAQLPDYFGPMIGDKKEVRIAEIGAGPVNTIGNTWPNVKVHIDASDVMQPEYQKFWVHHKKLPIVPVTYEDMENLSYPDASYDIVHCVNALDHTNDPKRALKEFLRICRPSGWVYLRHAPNQMEQYGGMHQWNIDFDGRIGECVFLNDKGKVFSLCDRVEENGKLVEWASGYNVTWDEKNQLVTAICQKT